MFQFSTANRILFGEGALERSLSLLNQYGYSALLVCGQDLSRSELLVHHFQQQNMRYQQVSVKGEPYIAMVEELAAEGRRFSPDMVIAMGGGSVIDTGKALAALIPNQGSVYDYIEVVGRALPLQNKPLPFIAIPTTAGTGAEVTPNAVLTSAQERIKTSMRSPQMLPDLAIVDPTYSAGASPELTARSGMDAFTHLMEAYVCNEPNPLSDMVCEEGLRRFVSAILPAVEEDDLRARSDLAFAAMLGGMARANAKLGAAHALGRALGGRLDIAHSSITAYIAPYVMQENILAATAAHRHDVLNRYRQLSCLLTGRHNAEIDDCVAWTRRLLTRLALPSISHSGLCETLFEEVAADAMRSNALKGNPLPLNQQRLVQILEKVCLSSDCGCQFTPLEGSESA
ncbi:Long-chain-alcohol dehydrogenase 1 [Vibrio stylophorae]|uniref:Long-chain-alcohol dehydrogenase 1 n=1 Tax=Vibrio stylophorae TaxID=659351 RepID=A0ABM8ZSY2_9VIBR|nr:iron-containing alcohol dehydrogenase [Vibrio stylophorae]CAH0533418.1 Long-chain-alcohol dehydrogenase 1 [Vibrio stylophorae]